MSRNKGYAPPPPTKSKNNMKPGSKTADSLVVMFDELTRNSRVLQEGGEDQFLQFSINQQHCRKRWEHAENEYNRVLVELQSCEAEVRKLEVKLGQARDLLSSETTIRKKTEMERDNISQKWELVRELLLCQNGNGDTININDETRSKIRKLEESLTTSRRGPNMYSPGLGLGLSPVNEMDSTASILTVSQLSFDDTQGSVLPHDDSRLRSGRVYKRKSSSGGAAQAAARHEKRSKGGIQRKSLEAIAARRSNGLVVEHFNERNIDSYIPSAPPLNDVVLAWQNSRPAPPTLPTSDSAVTLTPSHTSTSTLVSSLSPTTAYEPSTPVCRTHSKRGIDRAHQFVQKNNFKTETCGPCQRRIKFGKICYKCRECRAVAHPECRENVPLPCVPSGSAVKTPGKPGQGYARSNTLADYTPLTNPMVPGIIVHCINEIEKRGLVEVGIYRVPGSEREVRELRDKFLAGRGCPNLSQVDVHALCGTVKDFLRSLREPLVPNSMWHVFTSAASNPDCTDAESALFQAVSELPPPNRDTLAFLMLHFQKVAAAKETKMNQSNLAKILGPTVIGYSSIDAQPEDIMNEVGVQAATMEKLIGVDSDYWSTFLNQNRGDDLYKDNRFLSPATPEIMQASIFRTPGGDITPKATGRQSMTPAASRGRHLEVSTTGGKIFASPVLY